MSVFIYSITIPIVVALVATFITQYIIKYIWGYPILRIVEKSHNINTKTFDALAHLTVKNQEKSPILKFWIIYDGKIVKKGNYFEPDKVETLDIGLNLYKQSEEKINSLEMLLIYKGNAPVIGNWYKTKQLIDLDASGKGIRDVVISKRIHFWEWLFDKNLIAIREDK